MSSLLKDTTNQQKMNTTQASLKIRLAESLGIADFLIEKLVFLKKQKRYTIKTILGKNQIISKTKISIPKGYECQVEVLSTLNNSIPICRLTPQDKKDYLTIIYSHGNSEDLLDSLGYVTKLCRQIKAEFIVYDYSGYGNSNVDKTTQKSICEDLEIVLSWVTRNKNLGEIILWGFSLGSFPTISCASRFNLLGVILQSPFYSLLNIIEGDKNEVKHYQNDHFCNMSLIHRISCKTLILHSNKDQIIPFCHSKKLLEEFKKNCPAQNISKMRLIEVNILSHNGMHHFLSSQQSNSLQKGVRNFVEQLERQLKLSKILNIIPQNLQKLQQISQTITTKNSRQKTFNSFFSFCVCDELASNDESEISFEYRKKSNGFNLPQYTKSQLEH